MPRLYHPTLDRTVVRTEEQAAVLARSGWRHAVETPQLDTGETAYAAGTKPTDVGGETPAVQEPTPDNEPED